MLTPSFESLRCFDAAAHSQSFRAAARQVGLTPAALGQRIHQLEEQLGVALFERTTRSIALTQAGLELVPRARAAIEAATECYRPASGELGAWAQEFTIGSRYELGRSFLVPNLQGLMAAHKGLLVHLYFGSSQDLLLRIRNREIDCAISSARFTDPQLDSSRLHREDYVFVGARSLLKSTPLHHADQARHHTLIDHSSDLPLFRYWIDASGGGDRLRFRRVWRIGTIGAILDLVLAGAGVAVLPRYLVAGELKRGRLLPILPSVVPQFDYFRLVYRADDPRRVLMESIAKYLLDQPLR